MVVERRRITEELKAGDKSSFGIVRGALRHAASTKTIGLKPSAT